MNLTEKKKLEKPYVFLSYSHDDRKKVEIICEELIKLGFNCWIDDEIKPMQDFNDVIAEAIEECAVFLALFSKSYVNKDFCQKEHSCALDNNKARVVVCLDDVSRHTPSLKKGLFSYYAGLSMLGYGKGVGESKEELREFAREIAKSSGFEQLKRFTDTGDEKYRPSTTALEELVARISLYTEKQYYQEGNYVFDSINPSLFASIKEIADEGEYVSQREKTLVEHILDNSGRKNIFLTGEGGNGKTVSLLSACETLISQGICAIYIPARELCHYDNDIEKFIYEKIFHRSDSLNKHFEELIKALRDTEDLHIIVMLDGANEIPVSSFSNNIVYAIKDKYLELGMRFVISSRNDMRRDVKLTDTFRHLQLQPLSKKSIELYISERGLPALDDRMLSVIRTPLLLTLYAGAETLREKYRSVDGISLEENPDTPGKIMHNFFQTQLFRASEEVSFDYAEHLVLLEYLLPKIAFRMVEKDTLLLETDDFFDCMEEAQDDIRYKWYSRDRLRVELDGLSFSATEENFDKLFNLARNSLHFICLGEGGYEFSHHTFRDYFAAMFVANEIKAICRKSSRAQEAEPLLESMPFEPEIIDFIADILHEREAKPHFSDGWSFPGKTSNAPSEKSCTEKILSVWRGRDDEGARAAVYNLVSIMKSGRDKNLAYCDFSRLDMRGLNLYGCEFTQWYENDIYPSSFDGAYLDRECFVNSGHDSSVSALCSCGKYIFSGNRNGEVKIYDTEKEEWTKTISFCEDAVVHLECDGNKNEIIAVYPNDIYIYRFLTGETVKRVKNRHRSKAFRYAAAEGGGLCVSYNLEPLVFYNEDGEKLPLPSDSFRFDVPAKCADWAPEKAGFARGYAGLVSVCFFDESGKCRIHEALRDKLVADKVEGPDAASVAGVKSTLLSRPRENKTTVRVGETEFIIARGNLIYQLDTGTARPTKWRRFTEDIEKITFDGTNIFVSLKSSLVCLRKDFSFHDAFLRVNNSTEVTALRFSRDGKRLLAATGYTLWEFDVLTLEILHKRTFSRKVECADYTDTGVVVGCDTDVILLDEGFSESLTLHGARIAPVLWIQKSHDGEGYYIISKNGEIKKMDDNLVVQRIRTLRGVKKCVWGRDRLTGEIQLIFTRGEGGADSIRYSFGKDIAEPLGWRYEFYEKEDGRIYAERRIYKLDSNLCLLMIDNKPPYSKIKYYNNMGVFIYGCSFRGIGGNLSNGENIDFIYRNGGLIGDNR